MKVKNGEESFEVLLGNRKLLKNKGVEIPDEINTNFESLEF